MHAMRAHLINANATNLYALSLRAKAQFPAHNGNHPARVGKNMQTLWQYSEKAARYEAIRASGSQFLMEIDRKRTEHCTSLKSPHLRITPKPKLASFSPHP